MKPLVFMGREFENAERLKAAFPAFRGDDAIRAIRAGATTPMEVETACHEYRQAARRRVLKACRSNARIVNTRAKESKESKEREAKKRAAKKKGRAA